MIAGDGNLKGLEGKHGFQEVIGLDVSEGIGCEWAERAAVYFDIADFVTVQGIDVKGDVFAVFHLGGARADTAAAARVKCIDQVDDLCSQ